MHNMIKLYFIKYTKKIPTYSKKESLGKILSDPIQKP